MTGIQIAGLAVLAVFYAAYFFKMFLQRRHGVTTEHLPGRQSPTPGSFWRPCFFNQNFRAFPKTDPHIPETLGETRLAGTNLTTSDMFRPENEKGDAEIMKSNNQINIPEARAAMDKFKMEAASEVGVNLKEGYNGDLTSREAGSVGGQMVKKMIEAYEQNLK